ncbi:hypothetical protein ACP26L_36170 (plasmid) [Paenibacillus sp. S-38]|uniref:hypothetical protein n=1 Tax=Paenibacillus sp. S-38 TaxID=3416710 RepID=UPI003CF87080
MSIYSQVDHGLAIAVSKNGDAFAFNRGLAIHIDENEEVSVFADKVDGLDILAAATALIALFEDTTGEDFIERVVRMSKRKDHLQ